MKTSPLNERRYLWCTRVLFTCLTCPESRREPRLPPAPDDGPGPSAAPIQHQRVERLNLESIQNVLTF